MPGPLRGRASFYFPTLSPGAVDDLMHVIHFCRAYKKIRNLHRCHNSLTFPNLWGNSGVTASMKVSRFRSPTTRRQLRQGAYFNELVTGE